MNDTTYQQKMHNVRIAIVYDKNCIDLIDFMTWYFEFCFAFSLL